MGGTRDEDDCELRYNQPPAELVLWRPELPDRAPLISNLKSHKLPRHQPHRAPHGGGVRPPIQPARHLYRGGAESLPFPATPRPGAAPRVIQQAGMPARRKARGQELIEEPFLTAGIRINGLRSGISEHGSAQSGAPAAIGERNDPCGATP